MDDILGGMQSKVLDTISVKEAYTTTSGSKKTRVTTIKSMDNDGSLFVNVHSGRGSVCISKAILPKVIKALDSVGWTILEKSDSQRIKAVSYTHLRAHET